MVMLQRISISSPAERRARREARSVALRDRVLALRQGGATYAEIGDALGLSLERARQIVKAAQRLIDDPHWYDVLPMRAQTFLHSMNLAALPEREAAIAIARFTRRELLVAPNVGKGAVAAITDWLERHGLKSQPEKTHAFSQGAPLRERPADSPGPLAADHNHEEQAAWIIPPTT
jgi:hypothetical protein